MRITKYINNCFWTAFIHFPLRLCSHFMAISLSSANRNHIAAQYGVVQQPHAISAAADKPKMVVSEIAKKLFKLQLEYANNRALNVELIEDTLLIDASIVRKGKFHKKKRQERENNKKKKQQRKRCVEKKRVYSREELEALRFDNLDAQKNKWAAVHGGLCPVVAAEYDGLVASPNKNRTGFDRRPDFDQGSAMGSRNRRNIFVR